MYEDVVAANIGFCYVNGILDLQLEMWASFAHYLLYTLSFIIVDVLNFVYCQPEIKTSDTILKKKKTREI